ncbi:MAG: hypothetical protein AAF706_02605 [Bacteroidota bacterium]
MKAYLDAKTLAEEELANLEAAYEKGRAESKAEGLAQLSLEVVQSMLADNEPIDKINKYTSLVYYQPSTSREYHREI